MQFSKINHLEWDQELPDPDQCVWHKIFSHLFLLHTLKVDRYFLSKNSDPKAPVRLICVADTAEHAGGAAVYVGIELEYGTYCCRLVTAKSRLLGETIPRNELISVYL